MKKEWLPVAILTVIGFLIRLYLLNFHGDIEVDGAFYATLAKKVATLQAFFSPRIAPLYSYMIAAMAPFCPGFEEAGRWVSLIFGTAVLPLIYLLGRFFFSSRVGLIAAALAAFEPSLLQYSTAVYTESTYLFFFVTGILLGIRLLADKKFVFAVLAGIGWGLAYLTRQEGVIFLFILIVVLAAMTLKRVLKTGKGIGLILFLIVGFLAVAFPYLHFLKETTGKWTFSDKGTFQLWMGTQSVGPDWEKHSEKALFGLTPDGTRTVSEEFVYDAQLRKKLFPSVKEMLTTYLYNAGLILKSLLSQWLSPFLLFFIGIGFFALFSDEKYRKKWVWVGALIPYYLMVPFLYLDIRYYFSLLPFVLILAAWGIDQLGKKIFKSENRAWVIAVFVILSLFPTTISTALKKQKEGSFLREAGLWVRKNLPPGVRLMDRYPQIAFYGNAAHLPLPDASYEEILKFAHANKAQILVLRKNVISQFRPWLLFLFENPAAAPDLELIFKGRIQSGGIQDEVLIFKFKPVSP